MMSLEFLSDIIVPATLWPWSRLSLQKKRVPGILPGVGGNGGRCLGLTTLVPIVLKSGSLPPRILRVRPDLCRDCSALPLSLPYLLGKTSNILHGKVIRDASSNLHTYLLTTRCRVLLQQLTGLQLVKKFPSFHGTQRFITALTSARHLSLS